MNELNEKFLKDLGVSDWSYTENSSPITLDHYLNWLGRGDHGPLKYLEDHRKLMRKDIKEYFPEFKSALVFLFSYGGAKKKLEKYYESPKTNQFKIASYILGFDGLDYHSVLRDRLSKIGESLKNNDSDLEYKFSLDTQPILERDIAFRAGLGWFGKNSMLINQKEGSYLIIGALLLNKKLPEFNRKEELELDHCGNCRLCIDACPTDAIDEENRTLIASKCISTYTIELFKDTSSPPEGYTNSNGEIFGCDICQEVCPWTKKAGQSQEEVEFSPQMKDFLEYFHERKEIEVYNDIDSLSNRAYRKKFEKTPLGRTGRVGMLKNMRPFISEHQEKIDDE